MGYAPGRPGSLAYLCKGMSMVTSQCSDSGKGVPFTVIGMLTLEEGG